MQILTLRAIDAAEPLLASHRSSGGAAAAATHSGGSGRTHHRDSAPSRSKPLSTEDLQFRRRFRALLQLLRPWPALALALIAIGEAVVVAEGAVTLLPVPAACTALRWPSQQPSHPVLHDNCHLPAF